MVSLALEEIPGWVIGFGLFLLVMLLILGLKFAPALRSGLSSLGGLFP